MTNTIKQTYFLTHSVETVWEYLTNAELLEKWLMPNDFKLKDGYEFSFKTNPILQFDCDGVFHCKVLEIEPLKKLVYSWDTGPGDGTFNLKSIVEWILIKKENGTELQLTHSGFTDENLAIYTAMTDGWAKNVQKIIKHLNS